MKPIFLLTHGRPTLFVFCPGNVIYLKNHLCYRAFQIPNRRMPGCRSWASCTAFSVYWYDWQGASCYSTPDWWIQLPKVVQANPYRVCYGPLLSAGTVCYLDLTSRVCSCRCIQRIGCHSPGHGNDDKMYKQRVRDDDRTITPQGYNGRQEAFDQKEVP